MIALFPCKANPPHLGHILTLLRIKDDYDHIIVSVLDVNLAMSPKEVISTMDQVLNHFPGKFSFNIHQGSLTTRQSFDDLPKFDVLISGNEKLCDNVRKHGVVAKTIARTPGYRNEHLRDGYLKELQNGK